MSSIPLIAGELTAYLTVNKDGFRQGLQEAKRDLQAAGAEAEKQSAATTARTEKVVKDTNAAMTKVGAAAAAGGAAAGGKLAQGLEMGVVRAAPLIVAGVAGALSAGAPLVLTAATGVFAGIGIVAAAQSVRVRAAWTDTWSAISDGAVADAAPIQNVLVRLASTVGTAFERMRPALRGIFEDVAPQIDVFADGMLGLANNALPGFQRAIANSMPVTQGFASFLESVGTGLTGFLDAVTASAPAAGRAFAAIGEILENLLPTLGTLLGTGAELAAVVLPPLASVLGVVARALESVDGVLPAVAGGFIALKSAQAAIGWISGLGDALGRAKDSLLGMSPATVALTATIGGALAIYQRITDQSNQWATALLQGGAAAQTARSQMSNLGSAMSETNSGFGGFITNLVGMGIPMGAAMKAVDDTSDAYRNMLAEMDPVGRSKALLTQATNDLSAALDGEGKYANDVAGAQANYDAALAESERAAAELQMAIDGVTASMVEQATQAMSAASADFAYRDAKQKLADQIESTRVVMEDGESTAADMSGAMLALEKDTLAVADAAGRLAADALPAGTSELQRQQIAASATLTELVRMRDEMGSNFPPALNRAIQGLQASGAAVQGVSGNSVVATSMVRNFVGSLISLGQQRPTPTANLNSAPFAANAQWVSTYVGAINTMRASPIATLFANTWDAERQLNYAARSRTAYITAVTAVRNILPFGADGGDVSKLPVKRFAVGGSIGGKITGPGGPRDDRILMPTSAGLIATSNTEWIINAMAAARQGDRKMAALNAGLADIVMRSDRTVRGLAGGGPVSVNPATGTGHMNSGGVNIYGGLTVKVETPLNLMSDRDLNRAARAIEGKLVEIGRGRG